MDDIKSTEAAASNPQSKPIIFTMKGGAAAAADTPSFNHNNNNITTTSDQTTTSTSSWGTWEELLLACAVKRHGVHDWDTVAMELQAKTSLPPLLTTASNCNLKYLDLRRRFHSRQQNDDVPPDADDVHHDPHNNNTTNIPWLDDLRKLRVAQLRQELHGYDVSIVSLQLKVKRLEEEREDSFKDDNPKPDLEEEQQQDSNRHRSENDKTVRGKPDGSKPDHENQSVNGSNSTCSKNLDHDNKPGPGDRALSEPGPLSAGSDEPSKKTGSGQSDSDSDKGSSETVAKKRRVRGRQGKGGGDSAGELRESSEAQSSVSLTKKKNGKRHRRMEVPEQQQQQHNNEDVSLVKSEPLIEVLQLIRAHEHGSLFERRLSAQESDKYKSIVQQHVDLETIQSKLRKDSYSSCSLSFYRDLLLLFNNAVVFFPKSSLHSKTAHQLRRLVLNEMKKKNLITRPNHDPAPEPSDSVVPAPATSQQPKRPDQLERSDSLLSKQKSTAPIIVCRKRSSISSKPSAAAPSFGQTLKGDDNKKAAAFDLKSSIKNSKASSDNHAAAQKHGGSVVLKSAAAAKAKDNPVITGTRGSRRTSTSIAHHENNTNASKKKQSASPASLKAETPKADKNGKMEAAGSDKKRSAAADFLKRIKRNSPADTLKRGGTGTGTSSRSGGEQKRRGGIGKADKVKERVLRQSGNKKKQAKEESSSPSRRSVGRPPKKAAAEAANAVASPKRARESGGKQEASRRPKKRSRR
ncbi:uncharacterized protein LOC103947152 [Pyrus x bretschneideri]|uniref:uncharacterized protein LOC103947152 n=1 Tax=Pyrus x bretschneideri TaxID=225117 RepID=UPI002030186F|nr:uncharacterized protein LOC103947152 [Pyrus x bretschneideri]